MNYVAIRSWACCLLAIAVLMGCTNREAAIPAADQTRASDELISDRPENAVAERDANSADRGRLSAARAATAERVNSDRLPNAWRIHPQVISGGLPDGEAAFRELADLGVRTIISVDGAKPEIALAKRYGLRYVHMPHGYDGISDERAKELAKAVRDLPGPIYIHCHHGKHRSPAAATVASVGAGLLDRSLAVSILKTAGTSENYRGLYQSAGSAERFDAALLDALHVEYPESVQIPPIADAMITIEHLHDGLKALSANGWQDLAKRPDLDAAHEALLLREQYTELLRTEDVTRLGDNFRASLEKSEATARALETVLNEWKANGSSAPPPPAIDDALSVVTKSCTECHQAFRDIPLSEK